MDTKVCTRCKTEKATSEFSRDRRHRTGYKAHCKKCVKRYSQSPQGKEVARKATARYSKTESGKVYTMKYRKSEKMKEIRKAYKQSPAGRVSDRRYKAGEAGRAAQKRSVEKAKQDGRYQASQKASGKKYRSDPANREKIAARKAVSYAIKVGKIPPANSLPCHYCGGQAEAYHHYRGYDQGDRLAVLPTCGDCHRSQHAKELPQHHKGSVC